MKNKFRINPLNLIFNCLLDMYASRYHGFLLWCWRIGMWVSVSQPSIISS